MEKHALRKNMRYEKNTRSVGLVAIFKKSQFVLFNASAESVSCSLLWKVLE